MSTTTPHLFPTVDAAPRGGPTRRQWYDAVDLDLAARGDESIRDYPRSEWEFARLAGMTPCVAVDWVTSVPADAELLDAVR